ncbi:MAG: GNAT family N-acetyltransferase [Pacificimonas sp.]
MIETERLILREWREEDRAPFAALNADPDVMASLGPVMTRRESDALVDDLIGRASEKGHSFMPLIRKNDGAFLGFNGICTATVRQSFDGLPEIGWRLNRESWGKGYATEAARGALEWAWAELGAAHVISITSVNNTRSRAVMERIGMTQRAELDFDYPGMPKNNPLRAHVAYKIDRPKER